MATITPIHNKGTGPLRWKVIFRRKGLKQFCLNFNTYEEAAKWAKENEFKFIENPQPYYEIDRLKLRRKREQEL